MPSRLMKHTEHVHIPDATLQCLGVMEDVFCLDGIISFQHLSAGEVEVIFAGQYVDFPWNFLFTMFIDFEFLFKLTLF